MKSSRPKAASSRSPLGAESTGLPATVNRTLICPSPGVSISSARVATGSSPFASGNSLTRLLHRPTPYGLRRARISVAALGNIAPPGRSRLPVSTLTTSTSHWASVPNSVVQVPILAYTAAVRAAASSLASRTITSAGTPVRRATLSGGKCLAASRTSASPLTSASGLARSSANRVWTMPNSR